MINLKKIVQPYSTIFVDIDNTLCNYSYAHNTAITKVMNEFNISKEEYNLAKLNIKKRDLNANHHKKELYFKNICEIKGLPIIKTLEMYNMYQETFDDNLLSDAAMMDMFKYAKLSGKKIIAITNFYIIAQILKLQNAGFISYIDHMITSEEFELEKPNKKLFDYAMELSGNPPLSEVIMFGDSVVDDMTMFGVSYHPYNCSKILISISGKSGCGKSTISSILKDSMNATIIEGDGYHKYERSNDIWKSVTHYNPKVNNLIKMGLDIKNIYQDIEKINVPVYNHSTGKLDEELVIDHNKLDVVVIEGLHTLYPEVTGNYVKIKMFIDNQYADNQKIARDVESRNKTEDDVIKSIASRANDYDKYIAIQKEYSNFLITISDGKFKIEINDDIIINSLPYVNGVATIVGKYEELTDVLSDLMIKFQNSRYL